MTVVKQKEVVLIRHGQTGDNVDVGEVIYGIDGNITVSPGKKLSGWNSVSLTALGISQAVNAGGLLLEQTQLYLDKAVFVSSPQLRVQQTLGGVLCGLGFNPQNLQMTNDTRVMERSAGVLTSLTWAEAAMRWEPMKAGKNAPVFNDYLAQYPQGESLEMVYNRASTALDEYLENNQVIVIVSHEMTIKAMMSHLLRGCCDDATFAYKVPNAQPIILSQQVGGEFTVQ